MRDAAGLRAASESSRELAVEGGAVPRMLGCKRQRFLRPIAYCPGCWIMT